jgi:hypothetical protein
LFPAPFHPPTHSRAAPNVTSIEKEGEEVTYAQPVLRVGDTKARQQKARRKMQHLIYF